MVAQTLLTLVSLLTGMPFNQLGTLAGSKFYNVEATYYYLRWWGGGWASHASLWLVDVDQHGVSNRFLPLCQHPIRRPLRGRLRKPEAAVRQSCQDVPPSEEAGNEEAVSLSTEVRSVRQAQSNSPVGLDNRRGLWGKMDCWSNKSYRSRFDKHTTKTQIHKKDGWTPGVQKVQSRCWIYCHTPYFQLGLSRLCNEQIRLTNSSASQSESRAAFIRELTLSSAVLCFMFSVIILLNLYWSTWSHSDPGCTLQDGPGLIIHTYSKMLIIWTFETSMIYYTNTINYLQYIFIYFGVNT